MRKGSGKSSKAGINKQNAATKLAYTYDVFESGVRESQQVARERALEVQRRTEECSAVQEAKERVNRYKSQMSSANKRRQELGVQLNFFCNGDETKQESGKSSSEMLASPAQSWYYRGGSSVSFSRRDSWQLLRRAKNFLARRSLSPELIERFDCRRGWTKSKFEPETLLDLFPGLKYSYSSVLPRTVLARRRRVDVDSVDVDSVDVVSSRSGEIVRARIDDLSRSHSVRLDPVDAPKELYRYRLRIQDCLHWARCAGYAPVMMTLTVFHRWHSLKGLISVLKKAWNNFFTGTRAATRRASRMGLCGYIRRMEETINSGDDYNSGWHPHYHVILFVPFDKLSVLSSMEDELREAWFRSVSRYFVEEFGEAIPQAYELSFRQHGLWLSRVNRSSGGVELPLRVVRDGSYLSKIMGCDPSSVYGVDVEFTASTQKSSRIPFDLLLNDTAENNDLWVEYALATKCEKSFYFSQRLTRAMNEYYVAHPDKKPGLRSLPESTLVARVGVDVFRLFYRFFGVGEFFLQAAKGYDALRAWCSQKFLELPESVRSFYREEDFLPF